MSQYSISLSAAEQAVVESMVKAVEKNGHVLDSHSAGSPIKKGAIAVCSDEAGGRVLVLAMENIAHSLNRLTMNKLGEVVLNRDSHAVMNEPVSFEEYEQVFNDSHKECFCGPVRINIVHVFGK